MQGGSGVQRGRVSLLLVRARRSASTPHLICHVPQSLFPQETLLALHVQGHS